MSTEDLLGQIPIYISFSFARCPPPSNAFFVIVRRNGWIGRWHIFGTFCSSKMFSKGDFVNERPTIPLYHNTTYPHFYLPQDVPLSTAFVGKHICSSFCQSSFCQQKTNLTKSYFVKGHLFWWYVIYHAFPWNFVGTVFMFVAFGMVAVEISCSICAIAHQKHPSKTRR